MAVPALLHFRCIFPVLQLKVEDSDLFGWICLATWQKDKLVLIARNCEVSSFPLQGRQKVHREIFGTESLDLWNYHSFIALFKGKQGLFDLDQASSWSFKALAELELYWLQGPLSNWVKCKDGQAPLLLDRIDEVLYPAHLSTSVFRF